MCMDHLPLAALLALHPGNPVIDLGIIASGSHAVQRDDSGIAEDSDVQMPCP